MGTHSSKKWRLRYGVPCWRKAVLFLLFVSGLNIILKIGTRPEDELGDNEYDLIAGGALEPRSYVAMLTIPSEDGKLTALQHSKSCYAVRHGYAYIVEKENFLKKAAQTKHVKWADGDLLPLPQGWNLPYGWNKVVAIQKHLKDYEWIFWHDPATAVVNFTIPIESFIDERYDLILVDHPVAVFNNAFLIRNSDWSRKFLRRWWIEGCKDQWESGDAGALRNALVWILAGTRFAYEYNDGCVGSSDERRCWRKVIGTDFRSPYGRRAVPHVKFLNPVGPDFLSWRQPHGGDEQLWTRDLLLQRGDLVVAVDVGEYETEVEEEGGPGQMEHCTALTAEVHMPTVHFSYVHGREFGDPLAPLAMLLGAPSLSSEATARLDGAVAGVAKQIAANCHDAPGSRTCGGTLPPVGRLALLSRVANWSDVNTICDAHFGTGASATAWCLARPGAQVLMLDTADMQHAGAVVHTVRKRLAASQVQLVRGRMEDHVKDTRCDIVRVSGSAAGTLPLRALDTLHALSDCRTLVILDDVPLDVEPHPAMHAWAVLAERNRVRPIQCAAVGSATPSDPGASARVGFCLGRYVYDVCP